MGSRLNIKKAYIAGFLDGDGSIMLQVKKRSDTSRGYRFMVTICFYQDTRHEQPLHWIREVLGAGYVSRRNDGMSELRINGFSTVKSILVSLKPYIRFKKVQVDAMIAACIIFDTKIRMLSKEQLLSIVNLVLMIQNENYSAHRKKSKEELLKIFSLTP